MWWMCLPPRRRRRGPKSEEGRESIDAVLIYGSLLATSLMSKDIARELLGTIGSDRPTRTRAHVRRLVRHHPASPVRSLLG
jgi:hypothetical protein